MDDKTLLKIVKDLITEEPFFGLFLIGVNKTWDEKIPSACVGLRGINPEMKFNPYKWAKLPDNQRKGLMKHETLHICFFHITHHWAHLTNKKIANIAMDIHINQIVGKENMPGGEHKTLDDFKEFYAKYFDDLIAQKDSLSEEDFKRKVLEAPGRSCFIEDFDIPLEKNMGTQYYYDKLLEAHENDSSEHLKQIMAGMPDQNEEDDRDAPWEHRWEKFEEMDEAEERVFKSQIKHLTEEIVEDMKKSQGNIPAGIESLLELLKEKEPQFDWKAYFRRFTGGSLITYTKKTRRKQSKRFEGNPGLKIKTRKHVLVGVDTSGSVSNKELEEYFNEVHHMHKCGTEVTVIQCDTAISNIAKYTGREEGKIKIHGRGGTSFQPVIDYYNEHKKEFSCLVYLTDGGAGIPDGVDLGKILWVLTGPGDHLPGAKITINVK